MCKKREEKGQFFLISGSLKRLQDILKSNKKLKKCAKKRERTEKKEKKAKFSFMRIRIFGKIIGCFKIQ